MWALLRTANAIHDLNCDDNGECQMTRIMINLDRSGGRGAPMAALQTSLGVCSGSGLNPSRYPEFADHQYVECHKCGQVVRVTQRYYDGPRDVRNLALATHELPTKRGSKP